MLRSEADFNFPITYNEQYKLTKTHKGCGLPLRGLVVNKTYFYFDKNLYYFGFQVKAYTTSINAINTLKYNSCMTLCFLSVVAY